MLLLSRNPWQEDSFILETARTFNSSKVIMVISKKTCTSYNIF